MRRVSLLLLLLLLPLLAYADPAVEKPESANAPADQRLGESTTELTGPWKFHTGDNPDWAQRDSTIRAGRIWI